MQISIHDINEIKISAAQKLWPDEENLSHVRHIFFKTETEGDVEISCFGESKEKLQIIFPKIKEK